MTTDARVTLSVGIVGDGLQGKRIVPPSLYAAIQAEGFSMDDFVIQVSLTAPAETN